MDGFSGLGKLLLLAGLGMAVLGAVLLLAGKLPFIGKLPGDIHIKGERWSFYFPLATSIILSIILTVVINLFRK